jgi:hypothetical protein
MREVIPALALAATCATASTAFDGYDQIFHSIKI